MEKVLKYLGGGMLFLLVTKGLYAQDCTLGMGGRDSDIIVKVFQLSQEQQTSMQGWMGELELYHKDMADQVKELFKTHPQQNTEELQELASKYKVLRDEIEETAKAYDRRLLATFNEQQYLTYIALCREANRLPMRATSATSAVEPPE